MNSAAAVVDSATGLPRPGRSHGSSFAQWIVIVAGGLCCAAGALTMIAWHAHLTRLLVPSHVPTPMRYNAALAFVLCGIALLAGTWERRNLMKLAAALAGLVGLATIAENAFQVSFGIDDFLCPIYPVNGVVVGPRMGPNAALALVTASAALVLLAIRGKEWLRWVSVILACGTFVLGAVSAVGYATAIEAAHTWGDLSAMSLVAALCLLPLGLGMLAAAWDQSRRVSNSAPSWIPVPAAVILGSTSLLFWRALLTTSETLLPGMVLGAGLAMSALTVLAICLAQVTMAKNAQLDTVNRSLRAITDCNQALVHAGTEQELLDKTCAIFVEHCGYRLAWVGYAEHDEQKTVRPVAAAGITLEYIQNLPVTWADEPHGRGPTGTAIRSGRPCVVQDVLVDPCFAPWRERALQLGYRCSIALPLMAGSMPLGALSLYAPDTHAFSAPEIALLAELAGDIAFGVQTLRARAEHDRAEQERHRSEERYRSLVVASTQIVWTTNPQGEVAGDMPLWREFTGQTLEQIQGSGWIERLHPDDRERTALVWSTAVKNRTLYDTEFRLRRADGHYRHVAVRGVPVLDASGEIREWVGTCTDITSRKQGEEELRRASRYTRTLIEASFDLLFTISREGRITDVNQATERVTGVDRQQLIGSDFCNYFTDPEQARRGYQQVFAEGSVRDYPLAIRSVTGAITEVLYNATVFKNEAGEVEGVFAAARDVTEKKRTEAKLREQAALLELAHDAIIVHDLHHRILFWNSGAERTYGFAASEATGKIAYEILQTQFPLPLQTIEEQINESGQWSGELVHRHRNGSEIVVASRWSLLPEKGRPGALLEINRDITARKRAEEELRKASLYTRSLIEASLDPLVTISREGKITDVNQTTERVTGVNRQQLIGSDFSSYFTDPEQARRGYRQVFAAGMVQNYPLAIRHVSGRVTDVLYNATILRDEAGEVEGIFAAARDITLLKEAQNDLQRFAAELKRSNADLQDFASIASHDLQEPLRKVLAFADRLKEHCESGLDDLGRDYLDRMQNAATRMSSLIESLLEYSRVSTRAQPFQRVDLAQVMLEVLVDLESRIAEAHARIEFGQMPILSGDKLQLRLLLQNLLANAVKFRRAGVVPHIILDNRVVNGGCEITIRDNGVGFDEKYLDRIFRPFQRLHGRGEFEGSGMGLAICRKIVARHGGDITATSTPGQGSQFVVTLPFHASPERNEPWTITSAPSTSCSPKMTMTTSS